MTSIVSRKVIANEKVWYWAMYLLAFFVFNEWLSPHTYRFPLLALLVAAGIGACVIFVFIPLATSSLSKWGLVGLYLGASVVAMVADVLGESATYHSWSQTSDFWWIPGVAILMPAMLYVYRRVLSKRA